MNTKRNYKFILAGGFFADPKVRTGTMHRYRPDLSFCERQADEQGVR